jgi:hypothetical protein
MSSLINKKITRVVILLFLLNIFACRKDKITTDSAAKIEVSHDSVLFDTVFTTIGSSTKNIRIRNPNKQRINISSIQLQGGSTSPFILNVDGEKGISFSNIEIAPNDSLYIFIQVNVNPTNANSPVVMEDAINFLVNGNQQKVILEAWGQDAYYHRPNKAVYFQDGSYFSYSLVNDLQNSYTMVGEEYIWNKDKPHVIYGYLAIDSLQKLTISAGTKVFLNYKAGIWVYRYGQIKVLGARGNEVIFQGARRDKDYLDEPGQWDRIWINEGSDLNQINYAIIKNGFIGVQTEVTGNTVGGPGKLSITNTKIQNMSMWGLYSLAYNIYGGNNVISNCQEHSLNILFGGEYNFYHCTFSNFWNRNKGREKATININNYTSQQTLPLYAYFGNCIVDGKLANEINLDLKNSSIPELAPSYIFSNCWLKTQAATTNTLIYRSVRTGNNSLKYKDEATYDFSPHADELSIRGFTTQVAGSDAFKFRQDIAGKTRKVTAATGGITAGAYEIE